jgi:hypothetical protein
VLADIIPLSVCWCEAHVAQLPSDDSKPDLKGISGKLRPQPSGWDFDYDPGHRSLPGLTWVSEENQMYLSQSITRFFYESVFDRFLTLQWHYADQSFLSRLSNIDFRYWRAEHIVSVALLCRLVRSFLVSFFF